MRKGHARALAKWDAKFGGLFRIVLGDREAVGLETAK
jgi:hypothetical protein